MSDKLKNSAGNGHSNLDALLAMDTRYEELKLDRRAALNLMEDALAARKVAETLSAELRESEALLRGQKEAFQAAMNGEDLEASLGALVRVAVGHYPDTAARAAFYVTNEDNTSLSHVVGMPPEYAESVSDVRVGTDSFACGLAIALGEPVTTADVWLDPRWKERLWLAERFNFRACWSVPVRTAYGPILGTFALYFPEPREATPRDHELAGVLTAAATIIISRHREATERARAVRALRESGERMRLLMESATETAIFTTDRDGAINTWNSGSERLYGYPEGEILGRNAEILFTDDDRERGAHAREMETALESGRALDERWHRRKDDSTFFASGLTQPLGENGEQGFVKISRDMTERLRTEHARHEKELMQTLVNAQENERARIARDLHDELGQQLTALRLKLDRVSLDLPEPLETPINEVKDIAKSIDEGVDFLAWELRPAALDDLGLVPALEKYVREWSLYSGVAVRLNAPRMMDYRLEPEVETALYRIVQEGLNNILKHAKALNAALTVRQRNDSVVLIIDDDGEGFDPEDPVARSRGIGLIGLQERVQMIGGSLEIESEPGHGTTLFVKAPMPHH